MIWLIDHTSIVNTKKYNYFGYITGEYDKTHVRFFRDGRLIKHYIFDSFSTAQEFSRVYSDYLIHCDDVYTSKPIEPYFKKLGRGYLLK